MGEVGVPSIGALITENRGFGLSFRRAGLMLPAVTKFKSQQPIRIKCHQRPSTYSSQTSIDIPFYESPGASFDQYLEDKTRVYRAIFPDKISSQQLNEAEWRIHMLPIQFLHVSASPIVDMRLRCKTNSKDYPSGISPSISKVLLIDTVRCELQGHDTPSHFKLAIHGTLYSDRRGVRSRLKSQLEIKLTVNLPSVLPLIPEYVHRTVSESVLKTLLENMKDKVISNLLADYDKFRRERQMNQV